MAALLIILLSTVLIQSSVIVAGNNTPTKRARGALADEFRPAVFTLATLTLAAVYGFAITHYVLVPYKLEYLRTPSLLIGVALIFFAARKLFDNIPGAVRSPDLLSHLTAQVALLGIALFAAAFTESFIEACCYGSGAACALIILSSSFAAILERVDTIDIPFVFRGIPVALITVGLMALALMGFAGMVSR